MPQLKRKAVAKKGEILEKAGEDPTQRIISQAKEMNKSSSSAMTHTVVSGGGKRARPCDQEEEQDPKQAKLEPDEKADVRPVKVAKKEVAVKPVATKNTGQVLSLMALPPINPIVRIGDNVKVRISGNWNSGSVVKVSMKTNKCAVTAGQSQAVTWHKFSDPCLQLSQGVPCAATQPKATSYKVAGTTAKPASTSAATQPKATSYKVAGTTAKPASTSAATQPKATSSKVAATTAKPASTSAAAASATVGAQQQGAALSSQQVESLAAGFKSCLQYIRPPQWTMSKEEIEELSPEQLCCFPVDPFIHHYERNLQQVVSELQTEAEKQKAEAGRWREKLLGMRRMNSKLLTAINKDFDLSQEDESDRVDELLATCVNQALQQNPTENSTP